jgi:hypothetical protein
MVLGAVIYKPVKEATESKLVNKNVSLAVYKGSDYTSGVYDSTSAQVHIVVEKVTTKGQRSIVWDRTLDAKSLSLYPSIQNALKQNITVYNINEKKEYLVVDYTLTYNSNGAELQMHDAEVVKDSDTNRVDISI